MYESFWAMEASNVTAFLEEISIAKRLAYSSGPAEQAEQMGLPLRVMGKTAVINIRGPMIKTVPAIFEMLLGIYGTNSIKVAINQAAIDRKIETIFLMIDSPGGSVDGTVELADAVYNARQSKKVIAQVDGMAASAAYWVGSQASKIIAGRSSLVGSIGVFTMLYDYSRMYENAGIKAIPITSGKFKASGAEGTPITEAQQQEFQTIVDQYYADFKQAIKRGRPQMSMKSIESAADGRVFKADTEALRMGLIDGIAWPQDQLNKVLQKQRMAQRVAVARKRFTFK